VDALLERLERLERSIAAGPTMAAGAPMPAPGSSAPPAAADPVGKAGADVPVGHAGAVAPPPVRTGPAASAREELARVAGGSGAGPARPVRQPVKKATTAPTAAAPRPSAASDASSAPVAPTGPVDDPTSGPATPESVSADAPPRGPSGKAPMPSVAELEAAWEPLLSGFKGSTRAMYLPGRFVSSDASGVVLALANEPTREHCEKKRPEVEAALAAHFGRPVPLRLVTDAHADAASVARPASASSSGASRAEDEVLDVHSLEDAPSAASGVERLSEAFPGAELLEEP
jgi:hypothetical protein